MGTVYGLSFYREFMRLKESREAGEEICECVIVPTFGLLLKDTQYIYIYDCHNDLLVYVLDSNVLSTYCGGCIRT